MSCAERARGSDCLGGGPDVEGRLEEDFQGAQGALLAQTRLEGLPPARIWLDQYRRLRAEGEQGERGVCGGTDERIVRVEEKSKRGWQAGVLRMSRVAAMMRQCNQEARLGEQGRIQPRRM